MSFRTRRLPLTEEQKSRGAIYSSELVVKSPNVIGSTIHEVLQDDPRKDEIIANLEDVSFFKSMAKAFGYNVVNYVRR